MVSVYRWELINLFSKAKWEKPVVKAKRNIHYLPIPWISRWLSQIRMHEVTLTIRKWLLKERYSVLKM